MNLTVEEIFLLLSFRHETRRQALKEMSFADALVNDPELGTAVRTLIRKLQSMTDEQYQEYDFSAYEEDLCNEETDPSSFI